MEYIVIHGAYSGDNFGDTLLLALLCREAESRGFGVIASNACHKTLKHLPESISLLRSQGDESGALALVYGGGGYFGEQPLNRLRWNLRFIKTHLPIGFRFMKRKRPVLFCGVDFGPLSFVPARYMAKMLLRGASFVGARNRESKEFLNNKGVRGEHVVESADLALLLKEQSIRDIEETTCYNTSKRRVLVHPSFLTSESDDMREIANCISETLGGDANIDLGLMADRLDDSAGEILKGWMAHMSIPEERVFRYKNPWDTCALIKASDAVITNKLHVAIVASAYGKRVISLAKHPKNARYFEQLGRPELYIPLHSFSLDAFRDLVEKLKGGALDPVDVDARLLAKARRNLDAFDFVMKGGEV